MVPPYASCALMALAQAGLACATLVTNDTRVAANHTYDYVIVGAGLSGITVANRLSAEGFATLVIEAGPDERWNPRVNVAGDRVQHDPYCNWLYTAYAENGTALPGVVDSGACIGGSTSINGMVWNRPTAAEVDKLEALGNPGWNWESLETYLTAIERNHPPTEIQIEQGAGLDPSVHGFSGAVNVSFPTPMRIPKAVALYKEALQLTFPGLTISNDLSHRSTDNTVAASTSWTIWHDNVTGENLRSSAADALLWAPDQQREPLTVLANHKVDKVIFSEHVTASGVTFGVKPGSDVPGSQSGLFTVHATKEVILAAGALASASILERSGVGNASNLQAAGIKQLVDLPGVGCNLVDQPGTGSSALVAEQFQNDTGMIDDVNIFAPIISLVNIHQIWQEDAESYHDGLTSPNDLAARAAALVASGAAVNLEGATAILNATIDLIVNQHFPVAEIIGESYPTVLSAIYWPLMPLSRGHVHVKSADPFEGPVIIPRFLTDEFDQQVSVAIAQRAGSIFSSPPFSNVVADAYYDPALGPNGTYSEYLSWFEETSGGASHWMGSTAMLPRELGGVVDSKLRVYGTRNLRVIDAGVLPIEFTCHSSSIVYSVAQKAASLVLEDLSPGSW